MTGSITPNALSSARTALRLLGGSTSDKLRGVMQQKAAELAKAKAEAADPSVQDRPRPEDTAEYKDAQALTARDARIVNGEISPYDPSLPDVISGGAAFRSAGYAKDVEARDVNFVSRQVAMMSALHWTNAALQPVTQNAISDLIPDWARDMATMTTYRNNVGAAALAQGTLKAQFSNTDTLTAKVENGTLTYNTFTVTSAKYGKMLEVDTAGKITFFDQSGNAYDAAAYQAAARDGLIPELADYSTGTLMSQENARLLNVAI
jgi:hypothetical protein